MESDQGTALALPQGTGGETQQRGGEVLTTNHGVPVSDNQNSLKAGARGPTLLEDYVLREKIFHFDHERIPERIVHARGNGAHGFLPSAIVPGQALRISVGRKHFGKSLPSPIGSIQDCFTATSADRRRVLLGKSGRNGQ